LFSRTAYVTLAITPIIYALVSKRTKIIYVSVAMGVVLILVASNTVRQRATTGLDSGDVNQIMAGRVDNLWQPLMEEYLADPIKMAFGQGRYAIVSTSAFQRGQVLEVKHVHNMYFEQIMDVGLVGLFFMLGFMALVFGRFAKTLGAGGSLRLREYRYAVAVAATCYFLAGLTGRSMFPKGESSFFWVMVGIAVVIPLIKSSDESRSEADLETLDTGGRPEAGEK
jgi:O-antigen ligase